MFWGLHIPFGEAVVLQDVLRSIRITGAVLLNTSKPLGEDTVVVYVAAKAKDKPVAVIAFDTQSGRHLSVDLNIDEGEAVTFTTNMNSDFGDGVDISGYYVDKDKDDDDDEFGEDDEEVDIAISKLKNKCFLKFLNEEKEALKEDSKLPKLDNGSGKQEIFITRPTTIG